MEKLSILDVCRVRGYVFYTQLPRSRKHVILPCTYEKLGVLGIFMESSEIRFYLEELFDNMLKIRKFRGQPIKMACVVKIKLFYYGLILL